MWDNISGKNVSQDWRVPCAHEAWLFLKDTNPIIISSSIIIIITITIFVFIVIIMILMLLTGFLHIQISVPKYDVPALKIGCINRYRYFTKRFFFLITQKVVSTLKF